MNAARHFREAKAGNNGQPSPALMVSASGMPALSAGTVNKAITLKQNL